MGLSIFDTGGISIFGGQFSSQQTFNAGLLVADDQLLKIGKDGDQVQLNRSTILGANTVLASVLIGTPVAQAIAANSLMIANATSNGDIAMYVNDGGHSQMVFWANGDVADVALLAGSSGSVDFYIGGSKVFDLSNNGSKTTLIGLSGDYWQIGTLATNTSHSLNSENDLFIVGELEVNGTFYPNAQTLGDTVTLNSQVFDAGSGSVKIATTGQWEGFELESTRNDSYGPAFITNFVSTSPAIDDILFRLQVNGYDLDSPQNALSYFTIDFMVEDATAGSADGKVRVRLLSNQSANEVLTLSSLGALWADLSVDTLTYKVSGTQVVGARVVDARCDDAVNSGDGTTDGVIDSLRDALIAHGLLAAA